MRKNLAIVLLFLLIPVAFKTGEWCAKTFPNVFTTRVMGVGLLISLMILALSNMIWAQELSYEAGYEDGKKEADPKPE